MEEGDDALNERVGVLLVAIGTKLICRYDRFSAARTLARVIWCGMTQRRNRFRVAVAAICTGERPRARLRTGRFCRRFSSIAVR